MTHPHQPAEPESARVPAGRPPAGTPNPSPVGRLAATVDRLRREVRAAQAEADGRALIELAKGILVERLRCGPAQAARQLAELTEQAGMTPLEFAVEVINQASRDRLSEVTSAFLAATAGGAEVTGAPRSGSSAVRLRAAESGALAARDAQAVADSLMEHALRPSARRRWPSGRWAATGRSRWRAARDSRSRRRGAGDMCRPVWRPWRVVGSVSERASGSVVCRRPGCPPSAGITTRTAAGSPCLRAPAAGSTAYWRSSGPHRSNLSRRRSSVRSRPWPSCVRTPWRPPPRTTPTAPRGPPSCRTSPS